MATAAQGEQFRLLAAGPAWRGYARRRSPLALAGLDHFIAKPAPILLTGGQRNVQATGQENPKLFPPDGLGIGAGDGIAPMGLAAALSYFV
jgi:hypothetical protein